MQCSKRKKGELRLRSLNIKEIYSYLEVTTSYFGGTQKGVEEKLPPHLSFTHPFKENSNRRRKDGKIKGL